MESPNYDRLVRILRRHIVFFYHSHSGAILEVNDVLPEDDNQYVKTTLNPDRYHAVRAGMMATFFVYLPDRPDAFEAVAPPKHGLGLFYEAGNMAGFYDGEHAAIVLRELYETSELIAGFGTLKKISGECKDESGYFLAPLTAPLPEEAYREDEFDYAKRIATDDTETIYLS